MSLFITVTTNSERSEHISSFINICINHLCRCACECVVWNVGSGGSGIRVREVNELNFTSLDRIRYKYVKYVMYVLCVLCVLCSVTLLVCLDIDIQLLYSRVKQLSSCMGKIIRLSFNDPINSNLPNFKFNHQTQKIINLPWVPHASNGNMRLLKLYELD